MKPKPLRQKEKRGREWSPWRKTYEMRIIGVTGDDRDWYYRKLMRIGCLLFFPKIKIETHTYTIIEQGTIFVFQGCHKLAMKKV